MLNCQKGDYPLIYLGIHVRPTKLHHDDGLPVIDKVDKKLA